jgi:type I restriction enzyme S subunit
MSSSEWKKTVWGEIATLEYGKSLRDYKGSEGDVPVYGTNGQIGFTDKPLCKIPSVIIGRKGAYRGVHYSASPFFVIDTAFYLKPKVEGLDLKYAYYHLLTQDINSMDSGSAIPSTSREDFYNLEISLPPLETQKRIVNILSALDEKIELNRQTNQTLEAIAQAIYKEWFVNFNFPRATGEMQESELGPIPQGWRVGKLEECFDFLEGPGLRNWQYKPEGIRFINIRLINNNDIDIAKANFISEEEAKSKYSHFLLKPRDMVVSTSGTLGRTAIVRESHLPLMLNTSVIRFRPVDSALYSFMYQFLQSDFFYKELTAHAAGSVQLNFGPSHLKRIMMIIPPIQIIEQYAQNVSDLYSKMGLILDENQSLGLIRDGLLPRLMNGEIEV